MVAKARTRNRETLAELRADVLAGRLQPGQKLAFADMCATYSVSVGVLREALSALVEQGLVVSAPQQGFRVASISTDDLLHLTDVRREIESLALRRAISEGGLAWESEVLAAHHRLANIPLTCQDNAERVSEEWVEAHSRFHSVLLEGCANPRITAIASDLRASAELYRQWSVSLRHEVEPRDIVGEHRAITEAVLARDVESAVRLLNEHIQRTTNLLLEIGIPSTDAGIVQRS